MQLYLINLCSEKAHICSGLRKSQSGLSPDFSELMFTVMPLFPFLIACEKYVYKSSTRSRDNIRNEITTFHCLFQYIDYALIYFYNENFTKHCLGSLHRIQLSLFIKWYRKVNYRSSIVWWFQIINTTCCFVCLLKTFGD